MGAGSAGFGGRVGRDGAVGTAIVGSKAGGDSLFFYPFRGQKKPRHPDTSSPDPGPVGRQAWAETEANEGVPGRGDKEARPLP